MPQPKRHASGALRQAAYRARYKRTRQTELAAKGLPTLPAIPTMPGWPRWNASSSAASELLSCTIGEMPIRVRRDKTISMTGQRPGRQVSAAKNIRTRSTHSRPS